MYRSVVEGVMIFYQLNETTLFPPQCLSSLKGRICSLKTSREGLVSPCVLIGLMAGTRPTGQGC